MSATITKLKPNDRICQDAEPIALIYRSMGTKVAEEVVSRALNELTLSMSGMAEQVEGKDLMNLARQLRRLERMATQLGLVSLSRVAIDVRNCLEGEDVTAFSAVWARLLRVAKRSLAAESGVLDQQI